MIEEIERLRKELEALRADLKRAAAFDSARWEALLAAAPPVKPVLRTSITPAIHDGAHAAHHRRSLPALVTDDAGNTRVIRPGGAQPPGGGGHGPGGGPGPGGGHSPGGGHGGHHHGGGHDHDDKPKK